MSPSTIAAGAWFAVQGAASLAVLARLARGRRRIPPVTPPLDPPHARTTVVVPTFNEARRIPPLLAALEREPAPVAEIIVVDSHSSDGTQALVEAAARRDPRIRLVADPPLPAGWIGKAWALETATAHATGDWILGLDADTVPRPGIAAAAVTVAERHGYDLVSFSPRFAGQSTLQRWLHPALLTTLVYRFGPPSDAARPRRVIANGQCYLVKRDVLVREGGYAPVRASFAEDVSLARHLASRGARVAFLDGSRLLDIYSYETVAQLWREWGRSIDMQYSTPPLQQTIDVAVLALTQGVPVPVLLAAAFGAPVGAPLVAPLVALNGGLLAVRALLSFALAPSYERRGVAYWLSPLADPLAALRMLLSSLRRPTTWRGRNYSGARSEEE